MKNKVQSGRCGDALKEVSMCSSYRLRSFSGIVILLISPEVGATFHFRSLFGIEKLEVAIMKTQLVAGLRKENLAIIFGPTLSLYLEGKSM